MVVQWLYLSGTERHDFKRIEDSSVLVMILLERMA